MVLSFIVGLVVGIIFIVWMDCVSDDRAVRLGTWIHNGIAYRLDRFEGKQEKL